jgi:hypothetical protein
MYLFYLETNLKFETKLLYMWFTLQICFDSFTLFKGAYFFSAVVLKPERRVKRSYIVRN